MSHLNLRVARALRASVLWVIWPLGWLLAISTPASAESRIKDIAAIESVRGNMLVGYGLVFGLNGTGDDLKKLGATKQSLLGMLDRLGVNSRDNRLETSNVAAVMVTATLPAFSRSGTRLDITVSSLGNAKSIQGGTLAVTPLQGADGEVYAVGQGQVEVGGFTAQGAGASITRGVPTSGRIANGGIVEREIDYDLARTRTVKIALRNPDLTTAQRIQDAINAYIGTTSASMIDPGTVLLTRPDGYKGTMFDIIADIENLKVDPDQSARVIIDSNTGTIIIGGDVRVSSVAVAQGNLTITVTETPQVSQPTPFSQTGQTTVVPRTQIDVDTGEKKRLAVIPAGVSLQDLVDGLNALGVGPRDLISILQAIKAAGALQADLEVM